MRNSIIFFYFSKQLERAASSYNNITLLQYSSINHLEKYVHIAVRNVISKLVNAHRLFDTTKIIKTADFDNILRHCSEGYNDNDLVAIFKTRVVIHVVQGRKRMNK